MIFATVLIVIAIGDNCFAQKTSAPILKFNLESKKIINTDVRDIEKMVFTVENLSSDLKIQWQKSVLEHEIVKKLSFTDYDNSGIQKGELLLTKPNSLSDIRNIFNGFGLKEFYVGDVRILIKTVLNNEEAQKKAMDYVFKEFVFTKECNDTTLIDYYNFQVYYFETKIQFMWSNNYAKYLFDGTVTTFTENLDKMISRRENFKNNNK